MHESPCVHGGPNTLLTRPFPPFASSPCSPCAVEKAVHSMFDYLQRTTCIPYPAPAEPAKPAQPAAPTAAASPSATLVRPVSPKLLLSFGVAQVSLLWLVSQRVCCVNLHPGASEGSAAQGSLSARRLADSKPHPSWHPASIPQCSSLSKLPHRSAPGRPRAALVLPMVREGPLSHTAAPGASAFSATTMPTCGPAGWRPSIR